MRARTKSQEIASAPRLHLLRAAGIDGDKERYASVREEGPIRMKGVHEYRFISLDSAFQSTALRWKKKLFVIVVWFSAREWRHVGFKTVLLIWTRSHWLTHITIAVLLVTFCFHVPFFCKYQRHRYVYSNFYDSKQFSQLVRMRCSTFKTQNFVMPKYTLRKGYMCSKELENIYKQHF